MSDKNFKSTVLGQTSPLNQRDYIAKGMPATTASHGCDNGAAVRLWRGRWRGKCSGLLSVSAAHAARV